MKQIIPARLALLQSTNNWVGDLGTSVNCTNDRCKDSNIHEGSGAGTIGTNGKAMTACSIMDMQNMIERYVKECAKQ